MCSSIIDRLSFNIFLITDGSVNRLFWNSKDFIAYKYTQVQSNLILTNL